MGEAKRKPAMGGHLGTFNALHTKCLYIDPLSLSDLSRTLRGMPDAHSLKVVYPEASSSLALGRRGIAPLVSPPFLLGEVLSNSVAVLAGPQDKARDRSNPLALRHEHPSLSDRPHVLREACTQHASEHPKINNTFNRVLPRAHSSLQD